MLNGAETGIFEWVLVENIETFNFLYFLIKLARTLQLHMIHWIKQ